MKERAGASSRSPMTAWLGCFGSAASPKASTPLKESPPFKHVATTRTISTQTDLLSTASIGIQCQVSTSDDPTGKSAILTIPAAVSNGLKSPVRDVPVLVDNPAAYLTRTLSPPVPALELRGFSGVVRDRTSASRLSYGSTLSYSSYASNNRQSSASLQHCTLPEELLTLHRDGSLKDSQVEMDFSSASVKAARPPRHSKERMSLGEPRQRRPSRISSSIMKSWDGQELMGCQGDKSALREVYLEFARFGTREPVVTMDSFRFMKLCREVGLLCDDLTPTDIDLIFCKCKTVGSKRLKYGEFKTALAQIAHHLNKAPDEISNMIIASAGPLANNITLPDYVKFHDNKGTYTGVYKRGGPTTHDPPKELSQFVERKADPSSDRRGRAMKDSIADALNGTTAVDDQSFRA